MNLLESITFSIRSNKSAISFDLAIKLTYTNNMDMKVRAIPTAPTMA